MRPRLAQALWGALSDTRLTAAFVGVVIGIFFIGSFVAQRYAPGPPLQALYDPDLLYRLDWVGLTDVFRSGWFIFALAGLSLNLVCIIIARLPEYWEETSHRIPPAIHVDQLIGSKRADKYIILDLKTRLGREDFRDLALEWARARKLGKPHSIRDEGGFNELQMAAQQGRYARFWPLAGFASLLLVFLGGAIDFLYGFEGRMLLDEGARVNFLESVRGNTFGWPIHQEHDRPVPGYFEPGFDIECGKVDPNERRAVCLFREAGAPDQQRVVAVNRPVAFGGLVFHLKGISRHGRLGLGLKIQDKTANSEERIGRVEPGRVYRQGSSSFRVLEIKAGDERFGTSAQIEFTEANKEPERFWVFQNHPGYDAIHRPKSRFAFTIDRSGAGTQIAFQMYREPGYWVTAVGALLFLVFALRSVTTQFERYWFVWLPGRAVLVGWSDKLFLFEPVFLRTVASLRTKLTRGEKPHG